MISAHSLVDNTDLPTSFIIAVEHCLGAGESRRSRIILAHGSVSVAEFADATLSAFRWPVRIEGVSFDPALRTTRDWTLRSRFDGIVRVYGRKSAGSGGEVEYGIGTELSRALGPGALAVLKVEDYEFSMHISPSMAPGTAHNMQRNAPSIQETSIHHNAAGTGIDLPEIMVLAQDFLPGEKTYTARAANTANTEHPLGIPEGINIAEVNIELAGEDGVEDTLNCLNPELAELLRNNNELMVEYLPLLQALDLSREADIAPGIAEQLADLPEEKGAKNRAAAWARIVALSTLSDSTAVGQISADFMAAMGVDLNAQDIAERARDTQRVLATVGADEWQARLGDVTRPLVPQRSLVDRLEMYRYLLQR